MICQWFSLVTSSLVKIVAKYHLTRDQKSLFRVTHALLVKSLSICMLFHIQWGGFSVPSGWNPKLPSQYGGTHSCTHVRWLLIHFNHIWSFKAIISSALWDTVTRGWLWRFQRCLVVLLAYLLGFYGDPMSASRVRKQYDCCFEIWICHIRVCGSMILMLCLLSGLRIWILIFLHHQKYRTILNNFLTDASYWCHETSNHWQLVYFFNCWRQYSASLIYVKDISFPCHYVIMLNDHKKHTH